MDTDLNNFPGSDDDRCLFQNLARFGHYGCILDRINIIVMNLNSNLGFGPRSLLAERKV